MQLLRPDTVEGFNRKLGELSVQMHAYREGTEEKHKTYKKLDTAWTAEQTTAPGSLWANYLFKERSSKTDKQTISTHTADVSVPGLSTYWYNNKQFIVGTHEHDTSGIDYSGLVQRSGAYSGNQYVIADNAKNVSTAGFGEDKNSQLIRNEGWYLTDNDATEQQKQSDREILCQTVPGDILVKPGDHVVIIQDIRYTEEEGKLVVKDYADVDIIHSTQGAPLPQNGLWCVLKQTWGNLGTSNTSYQLRRIK